jgi:hypothetical protein
LPPEFFCHGQPVYPALTAIVGFQNHPYDFFIGLGYQEYSLPCFYFLCHPLPAFPSIWLEMYAPFFP